MVTAAQEAVSLPAQAEILTARRGGCLMDKEQGLTTVYQPALPSNIFPLLACMVANCADKLTAACAMPCLSVCLHEPQCVCSH